MHTLLLQVLAFIAVTTICTLYYLLVPASYMHAIRRFDILNGILRYLGPIGAMLSWLEPEFLNVRTTNTILPRSRSRSRKYHTLMAGTWVPQRKNDYQHPLTRSLNNVLATPRKVKGQTQPSPPEAWRGPSPLATCTICVQHRNIQDECFVFVLRLCHRNVSLLCCHLRAAFAIWFLTVLHHILQTFSTSKEWNKGFLIADLHAWACIHPCMHTNIHTSMHTY